MEFTEQVINIFSEEINKYNLKIEIENSDSVYIVYDKSDWVNQKQYKINVYREYSNVFLEIFNNQIIKYNFGILYYLLFNSNLKVYNEVLDIEEKNRLQLKEYLKIVSVILNDIKNNSFEWKNKYDNFYKDLRYIQSKLGKEFSFSHPIYKKFINKDVTWNKDLDMFQT